MKQKRIIISKNSQKTCIQESSKLL